MEEVLGLGVKMGALTVRNLEKPEGDLGYEEVRDDTVETVEKVTSVVGLRKCS